MSSKVWLPDPVSQSFLSPPSDATVTSLSLEPTVRKAPAATINRMSAANTTALYLTHTVDTPRVTADSDKSEKLITK